MSTISKILSSPPDNFSTTLNGSVSSSALTITLDSVTGLGTEGVGVIYKKDSDGEPITASIEFIHWTGINSNNLTLSDTGDRGITGSANGAQSHDSGDTFEVWVHSAYYSNAFAAVEHNTDGTHKETALDSMIAGTEAQGDIIYHNGTIWTRLAKGTDGQLLSLASGLPSWADAAVSSILTTSSYAPQGFLLNGKISVTVASNNITVAIKGMDGNDPSSSNKVYCRIGDTVRTISSALSVTKNAGTNWFNSGATGLATNEIDYFVYLGYNATDGVTMGFARIPYATQYSDFNTTSTNEKYCAISTITNAVSTDYYENIGRFAATLSASTSFNWSVPTFTAANLIQRPIYETRVLTYTPTLTGVTSPSVASTRYWLKGNMYFYYLDANGTGSTTAFTATSPFTVTLLGANSRFVQDNGAFITTAGRFDGTNMYKDMAIGAWTASGGRTWQGLITGYL